MNPSIASAIFLSLVGSSFASLGDKATGVISHAVNQVVKLSTRMFHEASFPILSAIPDFYKVFPPSMDPEEAGKTCRGATEYTYRYFDLPLDDDLLQEWVFKIKRFAANGFSTEAFILCFSAKLGEFLTYENQMSLTAVPELVAKYVNALIETLGLNDEEKMKDIDVVSPYHAALAKANAKFLQSVNPKISKSELDRIYKAFFEELEKHIA